MTGGGFIDLFEEIFAHRVAMALAWGVIPEREREEPKVACDDWIEEAFNLETRIAAIERLIEREGDRAINLDQNSPAVMRSHILDDLRHNLWVVRMKIMEES